MNNKKGKISNILSNIIIIILVAAIIVSATILFAWIFKFEFGIPVIIEIILSFLFMLWNLFENQVAVLFDTLKRKEYSFSKSYYDKDVRLSFSYLIRIKINNRYLLVRSNSRKNIFQPVGGVYHIDNPDEIKKKTGFYRDGTPGDPCDIRGKIKGRNIKKFIKWFNKKKDRECNPFREFKEEMIDTNIFPIELFNEENLNFTYYDTFYKGVYPDEFYNIKSLLRFDIYDLNLTLEQYEFIDKLKNRNIKLASYEEIVTFGVTKDHDERLFGTQTPYILEDFREKEKNNE